MTLYSELKQAIKIRVIIKRNNESARMLLLTIKKARMCRNYKL